MAQPQHTFLSYCRDDKALVRTLRHELMQGGLTIWWDDDILPGQDWKHEIRKAMKAAYAVVACLSQNLSTRDQSGVYPELRDAVGVLRTMKPGEVFVIPVRLCECDVPSIEIDGTRTLDSIQHLDLFPVSERAAQLERLLKVLREKAGLNGSNGLVASKKKSHVIVTLDVEYDTFDRKSENTLRLGLARFLDIDESDISIVAVKEGSVKVTIELPEKAARRLMLLRNEPGLVVALEGFPIKNVEATGLRWSTGSILAQTGKYQVGMDGKWALETLGDFSRLYSQVYSVMYALNVEHHDNVSGSFRRVFQSYPWRGGFSRLNFYRAVKNSMPVLQRPDVRSIQFASPGTMVLELVPDVALLIRASAVKLLDENSSAYAVYRNIDDRFAEMGLRKTHVRGQSEDDEGEISVRNLTDSQLAFVQESFSDLARAIDFKGADRLSELTGNRLAALKILMSYFRRIRDLVRMTRQDLIQL